MTAVPVAGDTQTSPLRPEEGWTVVALVLALGLSLATAIDEPAWVNGRGVLTDGLAWCALGGALVGYVGPKVGWGRWTTHLVGALLAGLLLPIAAGWAVMPGLSAAEAFRFTATGTLEAYLDLTVRGLPFTTQEVHYVLALAVLVWGTAQFGSYAVFGHRRPLSAVIVMGLVLLANMALTRRDQLGWLVLYAGVSLFLLIQMHVVGERSSWARRGIGDPSSISFIYLRGGTVFIVGAMLLALVLTQQAASSPLAGAWTGLNSQLVQISKQVGRLLPVGGDVRGGGGVSFGSSATISTQWFSDSGVALTATVPPAASGVKFLAATYDTFAIAGWIQGENREADVPASTSLLVHSPEVPAPNRVSRVTVTIRPVGFHDTSLLSPGLAETVDQPSRLYLTGLQGWFAAATVAADTPYTVAGLVPRAGGTDGITQNELRAASTVYPADVVAEYTGVPDGSIGPDAQALLATVLAMSPSRNPYDLASTMEAYLRSQAFQYSTDVRNLSCDSRSVVECFAHNRVGYCQYYASTMAILLRAANPADPIPTRYVQGFLPSDIVAGQETIRNFQAHAWVQVFFPGYGWIDFDPTGGGVGRPQDIPVGAPVASAPPAASSAAGSAGPGPTRRIFEPGERPGGGVPAPTPASTSDRGLAVLLAALLVVVLGVLIAAARWRGPSGTVSPDAAWTTVSKSASRFGFAPRPTQTVYEYAAALGDLVPVARPDITTIADAKVETTYSRAELSEERGHAVTAAARRLRVALVRLLFRQPSWWLRRRPRR